jgi:hypothetical protein
LAEVTIVGRIQEAHRLGRREPHSAQVTLQEPASRLDKIKQVILPGTL